MGLSGSGGTGGVGSLIPSPGSAIPSPGSMAPSALGLSQGFRNALGIAGDVMAGYGGEQGVFGPALLQHQHDNPAAPTGVKGAPVMPAYNGGAQPAAPVLQPGAPTNLGGLQGQFNHMPPMQQFLMTLLGKSRGIDPLQATQNMDLLHQRHNGGM